GLLAALILDPLQSNLHVRRVAEIRTLVDRIAIGKYRHFVEGAKRSAQGGEGLVHLLQRQVRHALVNDQRGRKRERIAGKELDLLLGAIFVDAEVALQQPIHQLAFVVLHRDWNGDETDRALQAKQFLATAFPGVGSAAGRHRLDSLRARRRSLWVSRLWRLLGAAASIWRRFGVSTRGRTLVVGCPLGWQVDAGSGRIVLRRGSVG